MKDLALNGRYALLKRLDGWMWASQVGAESDRMCLIHGHDELQENLVLLARRAEGRFRPAIADGAAVLDFREAGLCDHWLILHGYKIKHGALFVKHIMLALCFISAILIYQQGKVI